MNTTTIRRFGGMLPVLALGALSLACSGGSAEENSAEGTSAQTLTLGAYTTPREVYAQVKPLFAQHIQESGNVSLTFQDSYLGSGAQSRAIAEGFEADIAALSLEPDIQRLVDAGLITHDWKSGTHAGMVTRSIVVLGVREGNPHNIRDWTDLTRPGIEVLTPNPRTSGGAMWNIAAIYGAALRGQVDGVPAGDTARADDFLRRVLQNVTVMDKGARESMLTFEAGVADVIITYENEIVAAQRAGQAVEYVVPRSTILIENPVAVIDAYAQRHGTEETARAFVEFLTTEEVQRLFAAGGYRPVLSNIEAEFASSFPAVPDLFTIRDLGDWGIVVPAYFEDGGAFDRAAEGLSSASSTT